MTCSLRLPSSGIQNFAEQSDVHVQTVTFMCNQGGASFRWLAREKDSELWPSSSFFFYFHVCLCSSSLSSKDNYKRPLILGMLSALRLLFWWTGNAYLRLHEINTGDGWLQGEHVCLLLFPFRNPLWSLKIVIVNANSANILTYPKSTKAVISWTLWIGGIRIINLMSWWQSVG